MSLQDATERALVIETPHESSRKGKNCSPPRRQVLFVLASDTHCTGCWAATTSCKIFEGELSGVQPRRLSLCLEQDVLLDKTLTTSRVLVRTNNGVRTTESLKEMRGASSLHSFVVAPSEGWTMQIVPLGKFDDPNLLSYEGSYRAKSLRDPPRHRHGFSALIDAWLRIDPLGDKAREILSKARP